MDKDLLINFVKEKHKNQKRKHGTPYYEHPIAVANILKEKGFDDNYYTIALFHDLLEDTNTTEEEILNLSDKEVLETVKLLTKQKNYDNDLYIKNISNNECAKMVKLADRLHNLKEAVYTDTKFKNKYIEETKKYYLSMSKNTVFENDIKNALKKLIDSL